MGHNENSGIESFDVDGISIVTNSSEIKKNARRTSISKTSTSKTPNKKRTEEDEVFVSDDSAGNIKTKKTKKTTQNTINDSRNNSTVNAGEKTTVTTGTRGRKIKEPKPTKNLLLKKLDADQKNPTPKANKFEPPEIYDHTEDQSEYAMEIRTARPDSVKKVIEIISPLLTDAVLRFQPDGIYIFAMDAVKVAFVSVHLKAEYFEFYALNGRCYDIGVDTSNLNRILACVQKYETLSFIFHSPETCKNLHFIMESTTRKEFFMATIYGIDPKVNNYEIPEQRYKIEFEN